MPSLSSRPRIASLDLLRGLFLCIIIINHVSWAPSFFSFITGQSALFASAAEGFFVISGILVGYIYGPKILPKTKATTKKLWKRAYLLYVLSVALTLVFVSIAIVTPEGVYVENPWNKGLGSFLLNTFTLRFSFGWTDFLARYAVFMAAAPFALFLIASGKAWLVAAASIGIWAFFGRSEILMPFSSWQLLFMMSIIIGYYLPRIEQKARQAIHRYTHLPTLLYTFSGITFVVAALGLVVLPYLALPGWDSLVVFFDTHFSQASWWFSKPSLGIGRLAIGIVWFATLYVFFRRYELQINTFTRGALELLGKNSLFVFVLHSIYLTLLAVFVVPLSPPENIFLNSVMTLLTLCGIYFITRFYAARHHQLHS